jgi:polyisoprenoid-binding protein YceI
MLKSLLVLGWLLLRTAPSPGPKIADSELRFQIKNAGLTVDGTLTGLAADIDFDPAHPEQAHILASAPVSSIRTGISLRDKHLQKSDYFDAEQYPRILLQSKTIRQTSTGQYEGLFALTIKGTTRDVTLPFTYSATHEFRGQFKLNRLDFGIGKSSLILSKEVTVNIRVKLASGS